MTDDAEIPTPPWRRPRKTPRQRRPLSQDLIIEVALRVLDAEGIDALSMRRIAQELETGPASLYAHVSGKEELLELMVDVVIGEVRVPDPEPDRWQEQVAEIGRSMHQVFTAHPGLARAALGNIPVGENSLRMAERFLSVLRAGGVPDQQAAWFLDRFGLQVMADAFEESLHEEHGRHSEEDAHAYFAQVDAYFRSLPADRFPVITSMAGAMTTGDGDERLDFGIALMVRGLATYADPPAGR